MQKFSALIPDSSLALGFTLNFSSFFTVERSPISDAYTRRLSISFPINILDIGITLMIKILK
jgi:hypothetical protein